MIRVHHLNCGTMQPPSANLVNGRGGWLGWGHMVAHCLLVEGPESLVLVDTGFGLLDCASPGRVGPIGMFASLDADETAVRQIEALGFQRRDVRDIVLTHMDLDHAGGLPDFPDATVHVFEGEHAAAEEPSGRNRFRYRPVQWQHGPSWRLHGDADGEPWFGFDGVRALAAPEILLVPLRGHSPGHGGVAVNTGACWKLHCGDAYFHRGEVHDTPPRCPGGLRAFQRLVAVDDALRRRNQARLRDLAASHGHEVEVFCAHCPDELAALEVSPAGGRVSEPRRSTPSSPG